MAAVVTTDPYLVVETAFKSWDDKLATAVNLAAVAAEVVAETSGASAATSSAVTEKVSDQQKSYIRPNGEQYVPRTMKIFEERVHDVTFLKMAHDSQMPVLLFGDPGTGKTAMFEAAFGHDLVTIQGTIETETADFIGSWTQQTDGTYKWVDGPLPIAMENGAPLLIDEVALIDPRVMAVVYAVMDGRDELVVTANPERGIVKAAEGFMVFGACNPDVPGAIMSDALLSRFAFHIEVQTDWSLAKKLGVDAKMIQVARNLNLKKRDHAVTAAPQLRELLTFKKITASFGAEMALRNFVSQARPEDRKTVKEVIASVFGSEPAELTI